MSRNEQEAPYYGGGPLPDGVTSLRDARRIQEGAIRRYYALLEADARAAASRLPVWTPEQAEAEIGLLVKHGIIDLRPIPAIPPPLTES